MSILDTAADVLRCFSAERRELTVTDVVGLRGAPKSSTSRLLRAMRDAGLLESVGETKRYRPGALLFELGQAYRSGSTLVARASEVVAALVEKVGHTGYVSVLDGADVFGLTYHVGRHVLRVGTPVGQRLSANACATGRTLLARLPDDRIAALFADRFPVPSPHAPADLDALMQRIALVRARGYAESYDEANPGVGGLAAAVGDPKTGEVVSLCITFPAATVAPDERAAIALDLLEGARSIATIFGDRQCAAARVLPALAAE